ncbi:MAG: dethiobiotin synthase [Pseudomonadota bacterium]
MSAKRIVIVGTGTDMGKTILSLLMMQYLFSKGYNPLYIKPFQTGCKSVDDPGTDAGFIYQHIPNLYGSDPSFSIVHCHENPKAPYFAARDMNRTIDVNETLQAINDKEQAGWKGQPVSHLVIEAAGGLLVPVNANTTMADVMVQTNARPVIAANAGLGTINHTLLTLQCLERLGVQPVCVVLMDKHRKKTDPDMVKENIEAIESFSRTKVAGVIPYINDFSNPGSEPWNVIEQVLSLSDLKRNPY